MGITQKYFSRARDLAEEQRELAEKYRRDGLRSERDRDRLCEIERERELVKKVMDEEAARGAERELKTSEEDLISAELTDDDVSASFGLIASKQCPECGGTMRIRQGPFTDKGRRFWWQCTANNPWVCPTVKIDLLPGRSTILRKPDPDFDGPSAERRKVWVQPNVVAKTHGRLRASLGDDDEHMVCPHHVLPMKLMPKARVPGRMLLDSYEYICLGVMADGRSCEYKVEVATFAQVSSILRRRDGVGIIDS